MDIQVLGIIIVGGVFGIGFLVLGVYLIFDKTSRNHIPKPPSWLSNNKH
jgi:hypothetical protein|tara:strand:+ start:573 stop:719 length:147 start_codon:yes stop_codon:yes gene_type:complete